MAKIILDGQTYELKFPLRSLAALEEAWGIKTPDDVLRKFQVEVTSDIDFKINAYPTINSSIDLIYFGLYHLKDRNITREWVEEKLENTPEWRMTALITTIREFGNAYAGMFKPSEKTAKKK